MNAPTEIHDDRVAVTPDLEADREDAFRIEREGHGRRPILPRWRSCDDEAVGASCFMMTEMVCAERPV
jgi:hypothetical protein